jgi:hypothetical protein
MASAAVHITPASGSITHLVDACEITCTDVASNTLTGYDDTKYPASPAVVAFFKLSADGEDDLISPLLSTNADGTGAWPGSVIFPAAGTWTLDLIDSSDGSTQLATASVTVA